MSQCRILSCSALVLAMLAGISPMTAIAQASRKPFTAELETELWSFNPERFDGSSVHFSPDKKYFVVYCQRGRLDIDRPEDSLRFYRAADVENFLNQQEQALPPAPVWVVNLSNGKVGPNIEGFSYRWLPNSSGVAFLERTVEGNQRLVIADLKSKRLAPLTSENETVQSFDIRDRSRYVYTAASLETERMLAQDDERSPMIVGTGKWAVTLLLPENEVVKSLLSHRRYHLWAVIGDQRFEVKHDGAPFDAVGDDFALSPDGLSLATTLPVPEVPKSWETLYPPPSEHSWRIQAGRGTARQYVRIGLKTGTVQPLTGAPRGLEGGWFAYGETAWTSDGKTILLPDTYIKREDEAPSRACVAVVDLSAGTANCVEILKNRSEDGFHRIWAVDITPDGQRVAVGYGDLMPTERTQYRRSPNGSWQVERHIEGNRAIGNNGLEVTGKQSINDPPLLVASKGEISRVIWDPNPQLNNVELGEAIVYTWKDHDGREVKGGLYKPVHYKQGQRYPLVIQTHGFIAPDMFFPSGTGFPNEFAARQLAAAGFLVLQADDLENECMASDSTREGPCAASTYEAAAKHLVADGLADPDKIGLIGFSRSCFYVMEALTRTSYPFKAALIGDGVVYGYMQFLMDPSPGKVEPEIGVAPFGEGLQKWHELSPTFNLDKVKTPLMVVAHGPVSVNDMWEPYAGLYSLKKPVDLVMLKTTEHVITNPVERVASQTLSVDWFRFWMQDYENPDPAKAEQYKRWRELKKMQSENEHPSSAKAPTN